MTPQEEQFLQAAEKGNKEYVQVNLNNISLEVKTAAFVLSSSIEISQVLLSNGVDINARATEIQEENYVSDWTALGYACATANLIKVKWLVAKGADLHKTSHLIRPDRFTNWESDCTPQEITNSLTIAEIVRINNSRISSKEALLFDAVKFGFTEEVGNIIEQGINVNILNSNGETPLIVAVKNGKDTILDILLSAKANVSIKDKDGFSALLYAASAGNPQSVESLLQAGANPNDTLPNNQTALMLAARSGNSETVHLLIEAGADVMKCADNGYSVSLYAVIGGSITALQELLKHGVAKMETPQGTTALMLAVREENLNMVKFLLEMNADVNARDNNGQTALKIANVHNKPEIIALLKSAGAKE
ncbi:MAG: ankyrin repeat domain-containing protein [Elusimicrobiaceae bacterium]|nr:ankyrin repeat domain-containing protein [Elusimicrobiaceae bacterium]